MTRTRSFHRPRHPLWHARRAAIVSCMSIVATFCSSTSHAREVLTQGEFILHTAGWFADPQLSFTGLQVGLEIPSSGTVILTAKHSLEFYIPCLKSWVPDEGIMIFIGCDTDRFGDTLNQAPVLLGSADECVEVGKVGAIVRLRKFNPTTDCRPTEARWAGGYYAED